MFSFLSNEIFVGSTKKKKRIWNRRENESDYSNDDEALKYSNKFIFFRHHQVLPLHRFAQLVLTPLPKWGSKRYEYDEESGKHDQSTENRKTISRRKWKRKMHVCVCGTILEKYEYWRRSDGPSEWSRLDMAELGRVNSFKSGVFPLQQRRTVWWEVDQRRTAWSSVQVYPPPHYGTASFSASSTGIASCSTTTCGDFQAHRNRRKRLGQHIIKSDPRTLENQRQWR